jgi:hypothetical protein
MLLVTLLDSLENLCCCYHNFFVVADAAGHTAGQPGEGAQSGYGQAAGNEGGVHCLMRVQFFQHIPAHYSRLGTRVHAQIKRSP